MPEPFDMPRPEATWEERGGWVVRALVADVSLTMEQAAGLVGNLGYESIGFTTLQEMTPLVAGTKGGWGYAQWTGPRRREFEKWAAERSLGLASDEANYGFLVHELLGAYKGFASRLRLATNIEDACRLTHELYERPQDVLDGSYRSGPDRLKWARRSLAGAQAAVAPPPWHTSAAGDNPVELIRQAQRIIGAEPDGIPGEETRRKLREWREAHPGA